MKSSNRVLFLLGALLFLGIGRASADTMSYQFSGSVSASFDLPVMPTVTVFGIGQGFEVTPLNLMINGLPSNDFLTFYNSAVGGGFGACSGGECLDILVSGAQLYSGPESSPTMLPPGGGTFIDRRTGDPAGTFATPEPSTIGLMTFGLIVLGLAVSGFRRRSPIMA